MSDLFIPKVSVSATDYVLEQIKNSMINRRIRPGDRIPSENELATKLGVSRGSVRSAMKVLQSFGVIDIIQGDGTYMRKEPNKDAMNPLLFSLLVLDPDMSDMIKFREKIELDIIELIIKNDDLARDALPKLMQNLIEQKQLQLSGATAKGFADNDRAFHYILAANCGNIIFENVYTYVFEFFYPLLLDSHFAQDNGSLAETAHSLIYHAILERDYSMAKEAIIKSMEIWHDSVGS